MKKERILLPVLALSLALLTACGAQKESTPGDEQDTPQDEVQQNEPQGEAQTDAQLAELKNKTQEAGSLCALAYFADGDASAYSYLQDAQTVEAGGEEYYAIVPLDENGTIEIFPCELSETGELKTGEEPLYSGTSVPVLLRCNVSDIMPNTFVRVTDSTGAVLEFSPSISLKDGSVNAPGAFDFTVYPEGMGAE